MAEPIGNFTDKTPAINAVGESLRVYNQLMPIWQSHIRGEITREDFEAASRRIWDDEASKHATELLAALEKAVERQGFTNDELIAVRRVIAKAKGQA